MRTFQTCSGIVQFNIEINRSLARKVKEKEENSMKKVVKFGGSSLASARQFKKVGDIIRRSEEHTSELQSPA